MDQGASFQFYNGTRRSESVCHIDGLTYDWVLVTNPAAPTIRVGWIAAGAPNIRVPFVSDTCGSGKPSLLLSLSSRVHGSNV